jgi:hypothetical protein
MPRRPIEQELAAVRSLAARLGLGDTAPVVPKLARHTPRFARPPRITPRSCGERPPVLLNQIRSMM